MAKIKTSISIDEELFHEITEMSAKEDRSFSKQIAYLAKKGKELEESAKAKAGE